MDKLSRNDDYWKINQCGNWIDFNFYDDEKVVMCNFAFVKCSRDACIISCTLSDYSHIEITKDKQ